MTKIGRNQPCPCGSGKKYKVCCLQNKEVERQPEMEVVEMNTDGKPPLAEGMPNILLATPWTSWMISSGYCVGLRNMLVPFPHAFTIYKSRHTADARNAVCIDAIAQNWTHVFMIDADQVAATDTFIRLWNILEANNHDVIASGWATISGGPFEGKSSVLEANGPTEVRAIEPARLPKEPFKASCVGSPCLLFATKLLEKIQPPWFADLLIVDDTLEPIAVHEGEGGETTQFLWPFERRMTHDFTFSIRMVEAGVDIIVDPAVKLPHEYIAAV